MVGPAGEIHKTEDMTFTEMEGTNELGRGRKRKEGRKGASDDISGNTLREGGGYY